MPWKIHYSEWIGATYTNWSIKPCSIFADKNRQPGSLICLVFLRFNVIQWYKQKHFPVHFNWYPHQENSIINDFFSIKLETLTRGMCE